VQYRAVQLELSAGTIDYEDTGAGRPIVLLHGAVLTGAFWRHVAPPLAQDFRVIVPTLPMGSQRIAMRPDADLTPAGVANLVAELIEKLGLENAVVVGNDTGTALAQILASRRPELPGALVLTSGDAFEHFLPPKFKHLQVLARIPGAVWQTAQLLRLPLARRSPLGFGLLTKKGIPDDVSAGYVEALQRDAGVRRDAKRFLGSISKRYTLEAAEGLRRFDKPVLLVWGAEDRVFPIEDARRLQSLLPNARLEVVKNSRAYIPEDNPEDLVTLIRDFARSS
jgi:pimeloyl-ACP methyl ester carboxylesterase